MIDSHKGDVLVRSSHMGVIHLAILLLTKFKIKADRNTVLLQKVSISAIYTIAVVGVMTGL